MRLRVAVRDYLELISHRWFDAVVPEAFSFLPLAEEGPTTVIRYLQSVVRTRLMMQNAIFGWLQCRKRALYGFFHGAPLLFHRDCIGDHDHLCRSGDIQFHRRDSLQQMSQHRWIEMRNVLHRRSNPGFFNDQAVNAHSVETGCDQVKNRVPHGPAIVVAMEILHIRAAFKAIVPVVVKRLA